MKRVLDPHTTDRREPLEILAMLAGRTNYPQAKGGSGATATLTPDDVAQSLSASKDDLGVDMGLGIVCQIDRWERVFGLSYSPILSNLQAQRRYPGVVQGDKVIRLRKVLNVTYYAMLWPELSAKPHEAAKELCMDKNAYYCIHKHVESFLRNRANTAAYLACRFLFSLMDNSARTVEQEIQNSKGALVIREKLMDDANRENMIDVLLNTVERSPRPGVLHLPKKSVPSLLEPIDSIL